MRDHETTSAKSMRKEHPYLRSTAIERVGRAYLTRAIFRIPPPAHDVGGKDAEASMARHALPPFSSRWSRAWRLPVFLYCTGHSRVEKATSEAPALLAGHPSGVRRKPTHERRSDNGRCAEPCGNSPCTARETFRDWPGRMKGTADRPLSRTMRRCASME